METREYQQAREVTQLYALLSDTTAKIELHQARITCLEAEVNALLVLSQEYLRMIQRTRSLWV